MKTIPVSLILAGLLAPVAVYAQSGGEGRRKMQPAGDAKRANQQHFEKTWKAADKDGDGFISREEFAAMPRVRKLPEDKRMRVFERLDKNGDGKLGRDELRWMGRPKEGPRPGPQRLWELDVDGNAGVSFEEFKAGKLFQKLPAERQLEIFRRLDTDGDGVITPKDKPQPPFKREDGEPRHRRGAGPDKPAPPQMGPHAMIRRLDQDGDGALSFEEFRAGPTVRDLAEDEQEDRFEALDKNNDQKLTPDELAPPPVKKRGPREEMRPKEGRSPAPEPDR